VVKKLGFSFYNQSLALSFNEKGKSLSGIAPMDTPLSLIVFHFARNLLRYTFGFSVLYPLNWSLYTNLIRVD